MSHFWFVMRWLHILATPQPTEGGNVNVAVSRYLCDRRS